MAAAGAAPAASCVLVPAEVSVRKLQRQVEALRANAAWYRARGIVLLEHRDLDVDIGFQCRLPLGSGGGNLVAMPLATRITFTNYDVWAPSITFIDPMTREAIPHPPAVQGLAFRNDGAPLSGGPLQIFLERHPQTKGPFVCKRGVREYHTHFEHNGDDWLLHRDSDLGTLPQLVDMLWRHTTRTVTGLNFIAQRVEIGGGLISGGGVELRREDVDAIAEQLGPQIAQAMAAQQALAQQAAVAPPAVDPGSCPPER